MRSWAARNTLYQSRKKFRFKIGHDLTLRRQKLFTKANELIKSDPDVENVLDFVLADKNCKLKLKAKNGRYYHFNSEEELYATVQKLQHELNDLNLLKDEKEDELFH